MINQSQARTNYRRQARQREEATISFLAYLYGVSEDYVRRALTAEARRRLAYRSAWPSIQRGYQPAF